MAVTSIWSIKGWIGKVIKYAENPDKTKENNEGQISENQSQSTQGLEDVITYAVNTEKTRRGQSESMERKLVGESEELMEQYVSGVNCAPTTAREEMIAVKKRFGKEDGIVAFHGYQSFAPGECNPEMAHEIGKKLAEELWGSQYQVLIATHLDKANHLHNHFVVNSVSFLDGKRYHRTNQDYRDMRMVSDRLCKEYQLSVVQQPEQGKGKHYAEWQAEQQGKPSYHSMVKADVDEAIRKARTEKQFFFYLREKGYSFKFGKDITIRPEGRERGLKLKRNFGENYSLEAIRVRILEENELPAEKKFPVQRHYQIRVSGNFKQTRKIGGLRGLYLHYCYLLGILPKNHLSMSAKQVHVLFREDLLKLNTISKETKLLCHYHIDTAEQLFSLKDRLQKQMEQCVEERKHLRYKIRANRPEEEIQELKEQIKGLTEEIGTLRREVVVCDGIAARSKVIEEKFKMVREEKEKKEEQSHEHIRRSR
ncbi:MAG: relaxase/mobilization nuclease domain-containing protein [Mediterraneibacter faecis]